MSDYINNYLTLSTYNEYTCAQTTEPLIKENYGAFSLSAAVRYPYNPLRTDPQWKQPQVPGVN